MTTEPTRAGLGEEGFSLIEVVVAMVILAVGLLALEALGIGAARSINTANRQSELAVAATGALEARIREVRANPSGVATSQGCGTDAVSGFYVCSGVTVIVGESMARVTATAQRTPDDDETFQVGSYVFHPDIP